MIEVDDIIIVVIRQVNIVTNMIELLINSSATRHTCNNQNAFVTNMI